MNGTEQPGAGGGAAGGGTGGVRHRSNTFTPPPRQTSPVNPQRVPEWTQSLFVDGRRGSGTGTSLRRSIGGEMGGAEEDHIVHPSSPTTHYPSHIPYSPSSSSSYHARGTVSPPIRVSGGDVSDADGLTHRWSQDGELEWRDRGWAGSMDAGVDGEEWVSEVCLPCPAPREGHTFSLYAGCAYLFGGADGKQR